MRTDWFTELVCDRAGCQLPPVYASKDKIDLMGWGRVEHIDANGAKREYDLCPDCYERYLEQKKRQDAEFMALINGEER